jgi:CrcB protein
VITALTVAVAGSVGAVARFLTDAAVQGRRARSFPVGTLTVNIVGSFILGVVTGMVWYHGLGSRAHAVVGVGFCGAFTTWSSVTWETVRLAEDGLGGRALVTMVGGVATALAAVAVGIVVAALL